MEKAYVRKQLLILFQNADKLILNKGATKERIQTIFLKKLILLPNGGVECASPEKFRRLNSTRTPFAVPFETTNGKTFNAGIESASPKKCMADALTKMTTLQFPFQPTGKRTKKKPVKEAVPVKTKKRGRPPKDANSSKRALDLKACNKEHSGQNISLFRLTFTILILAYLVTITF